MGCVFLWLDLKLPISPSVWTDVLSMAIVVATPSTRTSVDEL